MLLLTICRCCFQNVHSHQDITIIITFPLSAMNFRSFRHFGPRKCHKDVDVKTLYKRSGSCKRRKLSTDKPDEMSPSIDISNTIEFPSLVKNLDEGAGSRCSQQSEESPENHLPDSSQGQSPSHVEPSLFPQDSQQLSEQQAGVSRRKDGNKREACNATLFDGTYAASDMDNRHGSGHSKEELSSIHLDGVEEPTTIEENERPTETCTGGLSKYLARQESILEWLQILTVEFTNLSIQMPVCATTRCDDITRYPLDEIAISLHHLDVSHLPEDPLYPWRGDIRDVPKYRPYEGPDLTRGHPASESVCHFTEDNLSSSKFLHRRLLDGMMAQHDQLHDPYDASAESEKCPRLLPHAMFTHIMWPKKLTARLFSDEIDTGRVISQSRVERPTIISRLPEHHQVKAYDIAHRIAVAAGDMKTMNRYLAEHHAHFESYEANYEYKKEEIRDKKLQHEKSWKTSMALNSLGDDNDDPLVPEWTVNAHWGGNEYFLPNATIDSNYSETLAGQRHQRKKRCVLATLDLWHQAYESMGQGPARAYQVRREEGHRVQTGSRWVDGRRGWTGLVMEESLI